ncbi:hypothetical protein L218DRAFT_852902 [Marasmius fiardii PR-910]|nr:hypothetical protein L218DRAFT_852902 [Marasmius fiardii PR-910]
MPALESQPAVRHGNLYIDTVVFQVEHTVFKIPSRYFNEKSEVFGAASNISAGCQAQEGSSDENPIILSPLPHDTNANDFELLVNIIMSLTFKLPPPTNYTLHQWLSVLKLATAWEFFEIRTLAMKSIAADKTRLVINRVSGSQKWSAMQKIRNGRGYRVRQWVSEGLTELADACSLPPVEEIETLGFQMMNLLFLREKVPKGCPECRNSGDFWCSYCNTKLPRKANRCDLALVEKYFSKELSKIKPPGE